MGAGTCRTLAAPTRGVCTDAEIHSILGWPQPVGWHRCPCRPDDSHPDPRSKYGCRSTLGPGCPHPGSRDRDRQWLGVCYSHRRNRYGCRNERSLSRPGKGRSTVALGQRQTEEQKQPLHSPKQVYLHRQSLRKPVGSNTGMKQCQKQSLGMQHEQFPQRLAPKHSEQVRTHMGVGDKTRPDQTAPRHPVQVS